MLASDDGKVTAARVGGAKDRESREPRLDFCVIGILWRQQREVAAERAGIEAPSRDPRAPDTEARELLQA